jgi:ABC-type cobalamin/Fe3+-siderophores transport system ATPase subunit
MSVGERCALLELQNVSYHGILHDVNLAWSHGQFVGLIGPNGAGKSTLLRILAGIWRPTTGSVYLNGKALSDMSARRRAKEIAYLPQHMPEDVAFTVEQYVEMGRYAYRTPWGHLEPESKEAVTNALNTLNLLDYRNAHLERLSGGERQRAGIARCIAQGSPIILLDEPISSLDLYYQVDILRRLQRLAHQGYLIVTAIHNLELAARYCTRLVLLHHGRIYAHSSPNDVLTERALLDVFQVSAKTYADPYDGFLRVSYPS